MINPIINAQLKKYKLQKPADEENALKEILQEVALFSLSTTDFFSKAAFQGGTSLRILHQLPRFSEDLDFILLRPDASFEWTRYLKSLLAGLEEFGLESEVLDKSKMDQNIRKAVLK